ncbi:MAG: amidohydrolase family protein [Acidobacteriota bacterium]|nr:amidohydrolase family protein [Acidobacteriota bacterium]
MRNKIFRLVIFLFTLGCNAQVTGTEKAAPTIVLENCRLVTMAADRVLPNHSVVVVGDKIAAIGPSDKITIPADARRIDCAGKYLLPGLTDAHVHIGDETELLSYLRHGVTTVFNLGGDYVDLFNNERLNIIELRDKVLRGELLGPTIFTTGRSLDGDPPTGPFQRRLASVQAATDAVLEQRRAGYDFIKVYDSLSPELHAAIIKTANRVGLAVFGHVPEPVGVRGTLTSGQHVIAHAEEFHPEFEDIADLPGTVKRLAEEVRKSGVYVIPNTAFISAMILQLEDLDAVLARPEVRYLAPRVRIWWEPRYNYYINRDNPEQFLAQVRKKRSWLIPLVRELHQQGVTLLMGSDASIPAALPGLAVHDELDDMVKAGLSPYEAIQTSTTHIETFATRFLAKKTRFGTIQVGRRADLILVSKNPLISVSNLRAIESVMVRGQWVSVKRLTELLKEKTAKFQE